MCDIECPYCGSEQDVYHDDGYGLVEDVVYEQECYECEKTFVYTISYHIYHYPKKADCLNGSEHIFVPTTTIPRKHTMMWCTGCDKRRKPTPEEYDLIMSA